MLLNESKLKTLIKSLIKEVTDEYSVFYDDFPGEDKIDSDYDKVLREALKRINRDIKLMKDIRSGHDPHQYEDIVNKDTTFQSRPEVIDPKDEPLVMKHIINAYREHTGDNRKDFALENKIYSMGGDVLSIEKAVKILFMPDPS